MSTTTAAMLLMTADHLTKELCSSTQAITGRQWETFDNTVYRCLHALVGPGRKLTGHDSPATAAVVTALHGYPTPLRPAACQSHTPAAAARLLGVPSYRVMKDIASGALPAQLVDREFRIASEQLDRRPDLTPADSTDPHPLARLTVALGAMTDVVAGHRAGHGSPLTDDAQIAAAMRQVLALTAVAARHTLAHCPIHEANRPLVIAQYATHAVDALGTGSECPQLWAMTSTSPPSMPTNANDRLECALRSWAAAARQHLKHPIPSTDVLRNIANSGIHILAVTDAVIGHSSPQGSGGPASSSLAHTLREAAMGLREAEVAWAPFTTGMPPSHEYVTASRAAYSALSDIATAVRDPHGALAAGVRIDLDRAVLDLCVAVRDLVSLLHTTERLPQRLLESELLFVRSRSIAPRTDTLKARSRGQLVVARPQDAPSLVSSTLAAFELAKAVPDVLFTVAAAQRAVTASQSLFTITADRFALPPPDRTAPADVPML